MICVQSFSIPDAKTGKKIRFSKGCDVGAVGEAAGLPKNFIEAYALVSKGLVDATSGEVAGSSPDTPSKGTKSTKTKGA